MCLKATSTSDLEVALEWWPSEGILGLGGMVRSTALLTSLYFKVALVIPGSTHGREKWDNRRSYIQYL